MKAHWHLFAIALLAACTTSPRESPISLAISVTSQQITVGQFPYDTIVATLTNLTSDSLTLRLPGDCPFDIWIRSSAGQRVAPAPGDCLLFPVPLYLAPHEKFTPSLVWAGGADWVGNASSPLPPGTYAVVASVAAVEGTAQATPVPVQLTAAP